MNPPTLIGMIVGLAMLASVLFWSVNDPSLSLNLPGLAIVLGSTLAATFIVSYPLSEVLRVFRLFGTVLRTEKLYTQHDIDELVQISRLWMRGDLQAVVSLPEDLDMGLLGENIEVSGQSGQLSFRLSLPR